MERVPAGPFSGASVAVAPVIGQLLAAPVLILLVGGARRLGERWFGLATAEAR